MNAMHLITSNSGNNIVRQRTEVTPEQGEILKALRYKEPALIQKISTDKLSALHEVIHNLGIPDMARDSEISYIYSCLTRILPRSELR